MLRTRLWMGAVLIALTVGVLVFDQWFDPWYPFLLLFLLTLGLLACHELLQLLPVARRPFGWLCYGSVAVLIDPANGQRLVPAQFFTERPRDRVRHIEEQKERIDTVEKAALFGASLYVHNI